MIRTAILAAASLGVIASTLPADQPKPGPGELEQKLFGVWQGPACGGEWTIGPDGTFESRHYSPGNNSLTGTWAVRWDALPPTLVLTIKTSDALDRIKVGETWQVKLVQLDDEALAYEWPAKPGKPVRWKRIKK